MRRLPRTLLAELERAVLDVTRDYRAFFDAAADLTHHEDAKSFSAHHAACRSALAHLEHLLKLSATASGRAGGEDLREAGELLLEARHAIALLPAPDHLILEDATDGDSPDEPH